jgi:hypothetical protein
MAEQNALAARLEHAEPQIVRIEEFLDLLDQLEVLVRRR